MPRLPAGCWLVKLSDVICMRVLLLLLAQYNGLAGTAGLALLRAFALTVFVAVIIFGVRLRHSQPCMLCHKSGYVHCACWFWQYHYY